MKTWFQCHNFGAPTPLVEQTLNTGITPFHDAESIPSREGVRKESVKNDFRIRGLIFTKSVSFHENINATGGHHLRWAARLVPLPVLSEMSGEHIRSTFSKAAAIYFTPPGACQFPIPERLAHLSDGRRFREEKQLLRLVQTHIPHNIHALSDLFDFRFIQWTLRSALWFPSAAAAAKLQSQAWAPQCSASSLPLWVPCLLHSLPTASWRRTDTPTGLLDMPLGMGSPTERAQTVLPHSAGTVIRLFSRRWPFSMWSTTSRIQFGFGSLEFQLQCSIVWRLSNEFWKRR